jgi:hypothetical protein
MRCVVVVSWSSSRAVHRTMVVAALAMITWMSRLFRTALSVTILTGVLSAEAPQHTTDQRAASPARFAAPRTPWGDPDLQGIWPSDHLVDVPFERPESFGTRAELTDAEFAAAQSRANTDISPPTAPPPHWLERGKASRLSSLVVDPPDGRLPPMTDDGARRAQQWRTTSAETYPFRGPEDLTPYDRCISRGVLGSAFPNIYSTGTEIQQIPGFVIIRYEMIHETRIVPLDGRPHIAPAIRSYMGDPRGRWDGDTLVIDTTNFNGKTGSYGRNGNGNPTSEALRLVERFTLLDANTLQYEVTVTDPETWRRPWTARFPLLRDDQYQMFEYGCHEGNYAMTNSLKGARARD